MQVSDRGVDFVSQWEGCSLTVYRDVGGVPTIGYGHALRPGETYSTITEGQARALLRCDLEIAERAIAEHLPGVELTQGQSDALISFAFNLGAAILGRGHTLGDALRRGDYAGAAAAFVLYDHVGGTENVGLKNRRLAERALFLEEPDAVA